MVNPDIPPCVAMAAIFRRITRFLAPHDQSRRPKSTSLPDLSPDEYLAGPHPMRRL